MVLVDTTIWSLALRRSRALLAPNETRLVSEWSRLVSEGQAWLMGLIRQEVLSGIRHPNHFEDLRDRLSAFDDVPLLTRDHEEAARFYNRCRTIGVTGSPIDLLICAVATRLDVALFTTDSDFTALSRHIPIRLHRAPASKG